MLVSYKPGDDVKLKLSFNDLQEHKPDLIYGKITGYGEENQKTGLDACIQAETGFMHMNGNVKIQEVLS